MNTPATTRPDAAPDLTDQMAASATQSASAHSTAPIAADPARLTSLDAVALGTPCVLCWLRADGVLAQASAGPLRQYGVRAAWSARCAPVVF